MIDGTPARLAMLISMIRDSPPAPAVLLEMNRRADAERHRDDAVSPMT